MKTITLLLVCTWINYISAITGDNITSSAKDDTNMVIKYIKKGLPDYLRNVTLKDLCSPKFESSISNTTACTYCEVALTVLLNARRNGFDRDTVAQIFEDLCFWTGITTKSVCYGLVEHQIDKILYVIDNRPQLEATRLCSVLMQNYQCTSPQGYEWKVNLPPRNYFEKNQVKKSKQSDSPLIIAHLTDFHYDPHYTPGANAECSESLCCQKSNGKPKSPEAAAGYWGDYRTCDSPWHTIINALNQITKTHTHLDYVYYTGDVINHKLYGQSQETNGKTISIFMKQLETSFGDVPVFPILGNHEAFPQDYYAPTNITDPELSTNWLFEKAAQEWSRWLPPDAQETVLRGGYYTVLLRPGLRIVAINSNICYTFNIWLFYHYIDPYDQFQWLIQVLQQAEDNGEYVHLLSHVPSGDSSCEKVWSREFRRIIRRFSHIISAQFNGHSHDDEFLLYYDKIETTKPVSVAWNGGSLTSYIDVNPNYKICLVDPNSFGVIDYSVWNFNLTEANLTPDSPPNWFELYSFKSAYGLNGTTPGDLGELVIKMAKNRKLLQQYYNRKSRFASQHKCSDDCLLKNLCRIVISTPGDTLQCDKLTEIWNAYNFNKNAQR